VNSYSSAVQHIRRLRGGSQAQLLRASDGAYYVCKFLNNPQHIRVLANEMFATRLSGTHSIVTGYTAWSRRSTIADLSFAN
jgi:hypothetical protein